MNNTLPASPTDITIREYQEDDDLTDADGSDPLLVDKFFHTKAITYQNNKLCSI